MKVKKLKLARLVAEKSYWIRLYGMGNECSVCKANRGRTDGPIKHNSGCLVLHCQEFIAKCESKLEWANSINQESCVLDGTAIKCNSGAILYVCSVCSENDYVLDGEDPHQLIKHKKHCDVYKARKIIKKYGETKGVTDA